MKNFIRATSAFLLFAMLATMLAACNGDPLKSLTDREKAELIMEKTNAAYSDKLVQTSEFSQVVEGTINAVETKTEISGSAKRTVLDATKDTMSTLNVQNLKISAMTGGVGVTKKYVSTSGYADGYMFTGYDSENADETDIFLKSKLDSKDYFPYLKKTEQEIGDLDYTSLCETVSVKLSDDKKSYVLRFEQSAGEENTEIEDMINVFTKSFGVRFKLVSFELECIADSETCVIYESDAKIVAESDKFGEDVLRFTYIIKSSSSLPNEADAVKPESLDSYTETGDLRFCGILSAHINNIISSNNIQFHFYTSQKITSYSETVSQYSEADTVNCGIKNDTYVQYIKAGSFPNNYIITFNGTEQTVSQGNNVVNNPMTELGARMYLSSILGNLPVSPEEFISVNNKGKVDGGILVEFDLIITDLSKQIFARFGYASEIKNASLKLSATFDEEMNVLSAKTELFGQVDVNGKTHTIRVENKIYSFSEADLSQVRVPRPKKN